ncbi:TIGR01244 family sulfur transferase [Oricola thermophila]|uniref:TIGR01244 family phosphatase n=1 Tax=Oricola thermophila TaxID=2742145 RepID=A0A6N1V9B7_9HYPH|nr:TIGR01244 family sulfur transferase [Oricola thermophila]QKV17591.1 TIGR01244 family phosphatase [Oricola thermophila]
MDIRWLDEKVAVCAQIAPHHMEELARAGFRTVVCNRPDGEDPGQPTFDEIAAAARAAGLTVTFQPITSANMNMDSARAFADAVGGSDGPVFAYCRTGTRCTMLWTMAGILAGKPKDELRDAAARAGYDMASLLDRLPG